MLLPRLRDQHDRYRAAFVSIGGPKAHATLGMTFVELSRRVRRGNTSPRTELSRPRERDRFSPRVGPYFPPGSEQSALNDRQGRSI